jgi:hypothetical protein
MNDPELSLKHLMRAMAWCRAKGELESMMNTYYGEEEKFEAMHVLFAKFIIEVEDNGLAE